MAWLWGLAEEPAYAAWTTHPVPAQPHTFMCGSDADMVSRDKGVIEMIARDMIVNIRGIHVAH